jgi:hypothetical protein
MNVYAPGKKFNHLTIIRCVGVAPNRNRRWEVQCDCGVIFEVAGGHLGSGHTKSCGCIKMAKPFIERLPAIMNKILPMPNGCWLWTGCTNNHGYGTVSVGNQSQYVHILMWEHFNGPVPEGLELDHLCRTPACCNPYPGHMEPVTHQVNCLRGNHPCFVRRREGFCKRGHEMTEENTARVSTRPNIRICKECARIRDARRRHGGS